MKTLFIIITVLIVVTVSSVTVHFTENGIKFEDIDLYKNERIQDATKAIFSFFLNIGPSLSIIYKTKDGSTHNIGELISVNVFDQKGTFKLRSKEKQISANEFKTILDNAGKIIIGVWTIKKKSDNVDKFNYWDNYFDFFDHEEYYDKDKDYYHQLENKEDAYDKVLRYLLKKAKLKKGKYKL
eukprot:113021_1